MSVMSKSSTRPDYPSPSRRWSGTNTTTTSLREHRSALAHLTSERDLLVAKAAAALEPLREARTRRAEVSELRSRLEDVHTNTKLLRLRNENSSSFRP